MKIGKLSNELLKELVLDHLKVSRKEVLRSSNLGEDVAVIKNDSKYFLFSTDPISATSKNIAKLAVHISCNDIYSGGGDAIGLLVTALIPPETKKEQIKDMMISLQEEASKLNVDIIGGHTEITDSVNRIVLSISSIGVSDKLLEGVKKDDSIIMTKKVGLEGTSIIVNELNDIEKYLSEEEILKAKKMDEKLSVYKESKVAREHNISFMHDITEGGVLGALHEVAQGSGLGFKVYKEKIKIDSITKKLSEKLNFDPYQLISSGSMLIMINEKDKKALIEDLKANNIESEIIGSFTKEKRFIMVDEKDKHIEVSIKEGDELYRVI